MSMISFLSSDNISNHVKVVKLLYDVSSSNYGYSTLFDDGMTKILYNK